MGFHIGLRANHLKFKARVDFSVIWVLWDFVVCFVWFLLLLLLGKVSLCFSSLEPMIFLPQASHDGIIAMSHLAWLQCL